MPRDIPVGNGQLLVAFDGDYQIRDLYYPHVGQEDHANNAASRFGVFADGPDGRGRMLWTTDEGWSKRLRYLRESLTTSVTLANDEAGLVLYCNDVVDFHRAVLVRRIRIKNLTDRSRRIGLFAHQNFRMYGSNVGDTAYYDPELRALIHYRKNRYLMATFFVDGEQRIDEYATGASGFRGAEGTWRDAEDGHLQGNAIAQGAVDSTGCVFVDLEPDGERTVYYALGAATSRAELTELHKFLFREGPAGVIDRTTAYWRLWVNGTNINFGNLPKRVIELFKRSLLVIRTQVNNNGAIIAANDSEVLQFSRDTYSYMWPRDGALVANALDMAGFPDLARWFYSFCADIITDEGYLLHKYNPDGSPASSWHPWIAKGVEQLPIQEDETALVLWALWRHYFRVRDIEFVRPLWLRLIRGAADFMAGYRDPETGLPRPSYDLWEERYGVHTFTVAAVYGGLRAARNFAVCFGDRNRAEQYMQACREIREAALRHLYSEENERFLRRLEVAEDGRLIPDETVDSSLVGVSKFGLLPAEDPRVVSTVRAIESRLWVKTRVGGIARYENDHYHRVSSDHRSVPGNPWFLCTIWVAEQSIDRATSLNELKIALPILEWAAGHALESGVLAEQVHPYDGVPVSVCPLTWSHATFVGAVVKYLEKLEELQVCDSCGQAVFRMRRTGPAHVIQQAMLERFGAADGEEVDPDRLQSVARFERDGRGATLAIDVRDCIGCEVCVAHCELDVLAMANDKAWIRRDRVEACTACGDCERVCPVGVVVFNRAPAGATRPAHAGASA
jgi:glucoamylase